MGIAPVTPVEAPTAPAPSNAELQAQLAAMAALVAEFQAKQANVHMPEPIKPREPVTRKLADGTIRVDL